MRVPLTATIVAGFCAVTPLMTASGEDLQQSTLDVETRARELVADWQGRLDELEAIARDGERQSMSAAKHLLLNLSAEMSQHVATGHEELIARTFRLKALLEVVPRRGDRRKAYDPQLQAVEAIGIARLFSQSAAADFSSFGSQGGVLEKGLTAGQRKLVKLQQSAAKMESEDRVFPPRRTGGVHDLYPRAARLAELEAKVEVHYLVDEDGTPWILDIPTPEAPTSLVLAAIRAVSDASYEPATLNGKAVSATASTTFDFRDP